MLLIFTFDINNKSSNQNIVNIDGDNINLPEGYFQGKINKFGAINITNGNNSIFVSKVDGVNVDKYLDDYMNRTQNQTVDIENTTINGTIVYKTEDGSAAENIHYWFVKNNKTYEIYTWDGDKNIEGIVNGLI